MITPEEFAHRLRDARYIRGMSQEELADRIKISPNLIIKYEGGKELPRMDFLEAMAEVLNADLEYLFGRQDMLVRAESIEVEGAVYGNCETPRP